MNSKLKKSLLVIVAIFIVYSIISQFGLFKIYTNSTIANEPNLKFKSKIFVSNIPNAKNGDFVCYKYDDKVFGKGIRIHRLCGQENDTLQIIDGVAYLNGIDIDKNLNLVCFYEMPESQYLKIKKEEKISEQFPAFLVDGKNINAFLESSMAKKHGLSSKRLTDKKGEADKYIEKVFHKKWNKDNFGPLVIPSGKIFVLGDNRNNSEDSRYIGLLDASQIVGKVIYN